MRIAFQANAKVALPVPTARGEDHAHVQGGHGDADHGAEAAQDGAGVVGEDLEIPGVPAATGGPRGREPETLVHARVNGALQGEGIYEMSLKKPITNYTGLAKTRQQLWLCVDNWFGSKSR